MKISPTSPATGRGAPWGFTLVELLLTIGILAVLVAILIPVSSNAKKAAEQAGCVNNLKQLGVGMHAYAADNDGYLPAGYLAPPIGSGTLEDFLAPYVAPPKDKARGISADTFYCPTNVRLGSPPMEGYLVNSKGEKYYKGWAGYFLGYRFNGSVHPQEGPDSLLPHRIRLANIKIPARMVSMMDTNTRLENGGPPSSAYGKASYFNPASSDSAGFGRVHSGRGNILFVDGHVENFDGSKPLPVASLPSQETTWWP